MISPGGFQLSTLGLDVTYLQYLVVFDICPGGLQVEEHHGRLHPLQADQRTLSRRSSSNASTPREHKTTAHLIILSSGGVDQQPAIHLLPPHHKPFLPALFRFSPLDIPCSFSFEPLEARC